MAIAIVIISCISMLMCLVRPFHRNNVYRTAQWMAKVSYIVGVEIEVRVPQTISPEQSYVYIGNHQNSYDLFTISKAVQPNTVSVGKKSLAWIPFFGQMYWLTGNILIDRNNQNKASNTITSTVDKIKKKGISVWLFPEGTRSYGRGILPFKTGAFRTAMSAGSPIVPCVCSNSNDIKLNRWNNGKLIIEYMDPISMEGLRTEDIRKLANDTRAKMTVKFDQLTQEAKQ